MLDQTNPTYIKITYADYNNLNDEVSLYFKLQNNSVVPKWVRKVQTAWSLGYPIDDPQRFYGFEDEHQSKLNVIDSINKVLDKLEHFWHIPVGKRLQNIDDQDTLNFLHHIFEIEHGTLNEKQLNPQFQKHISDLNILVHRCESIQRGNYPRHVVTYFGLPKTEVLDPADYENFTCQIEFGTVYLNYVEIGKTLLDMWSDRDEYIDPKAFRPFMHFSADFVVQFADYGYPKQDLHKILTEYYMQHQDFFATCGHDLDFLLNSTGMIPLAKLENYNRIDIIDQLSRRQFVKAVEFV